MLTDKHPSSITSEENKLRPTTDEAVFNPAALQPVVPAFEALVASTAIRKFEGSRNGTLPQDGNGVAVLSNGCQYRGNYSDGLMHGQGEITFPDKTRYAGEFSKGALTGRGKMFWPDGRFAALVRAIRSSFARCSIYDGEVKDGFRHGQGVLVDPHAGCKYEGQWQRGARTSLLLALTLRFASRIASRRRQADVRHGRQIVLRRAVGARTATRYIC